MFYVSKFWNNRKLYRKLHFSQGVSFVSKNVWTEKFLLGLRKGNSSEKTKEITFWVYQNGFSLSENIQRCHLSVNIRKFFHSLFKQQNTEINIRITESLPICLLSISDSFVFLKVCYCNSFFYTVLQSIRCCRINSLQNFFNTITNCCNRFILSPQKLSFVLTHPHFSQKYHSTNNTDTITVL